MGSSLAAGFVTPQGNITTWLNELAFVPVDYRENAPVDEWSGDRGVGVQYFSQQAVGRLLAPAGIDLPRDMPLPVKLEHVQKLMAAGDPRARRIYETIGVFFGYGIAHYADFYDLRNLLVLGRVMTGEGGDLILAQAREVLAAEFPEVAGRIRFHIPDEKEKRHGQAIAAASLPALRHSGDSCSFINPQRICSSPTAWRPKRRWPAPRTCASPRTRTISRSWPTTASPNASAGRTAGSPAWW